MAREERLRGRCGMRRGTVDHRHGVPPRGRIVRDHAHDIGYASEVQPGHDERYLQLILPSD